jgi:hypothetical protein
LKRPGRRASTSLATNTVAQQSPSSTSRIVPAAFEPWFLTFITEVGYDSAITPQELGEDNLEEVIKKWT